jgi:hypothetical protein
MYLCILAAKLESVWHLNSHTNWTVFSFEKQGINRMKFANDVVGALLKELQNLANNDKYVIIPSLWGGCCR